MLPQECRAGPSLGAGRVRARVSVGFGVAYISGGESQESGCYHPDASGDESEAQQEWMAGGKTSGKAELSSELEGVVWVR